MVDDFSAIFKTPVANRGNRLGCLAPRAGNADLNAAEPNAIAREALRAD